MYIESAPRRLLVVANETATADTLGTMIRSVVGSSEDAEVLVVAPALNSRIRYWLSDDDWARKLAMERVQLCVHQLLQEGILAEGMVGDADPLQAIEDALRAFPAEALVVSTHPEGRSNWLARDMIVKAEERFGLPVTHLVVEENTRLDAVAA
jgi:hypothetical protein